MYNRLYHCTDRSYHFQGYKKHSPVQFWSIDAFLYRLQLSIC